MDSTINFKELGFSQYEAACYLALTSQHPANGSQLSKVSGIARSRIYDVLRNLISKGFVLEVNPGQYAPLPADELIRHLKKDFSSHIDALEEQLSSVAQQEAMEYVWTLNGYDKVMAKAKDMIHTAQTEIYIRLFPRAHNHLIQDLLDADSRGVKIRYIAMGEVSRQFDVQVLHPDYGRLEEKIGGRSIDVISDRSQALVGIFEANNEDQSLISWTRNKWFVLANRDSLRHDFYHCFLEKILDQKQELTSDEKRIYHIIKTDD